MFWAEALHLSLPDAKLIADYYRRGRALYRHCHGACVVSCQADRSSAVAAPAGDVQELEAPGEPRLLPLLRVRRHSASIAEVGAEEQMQPARKACHACLRGTPALEEIRMLFGRPTCRGQI